MSTVQGVAAIYGLVDRHRKKALEVGGAPMLARFNPLLVSIVLFIGMAATIVFGTWMAIAKPLRPKIQIVEKKVYVGVPIPCPPSRTGPASTHGHKSPANSGSNNTTTYGGH